MRALFCSVAAAVVLLATAPAQSMAAIQAVIDNDTVELGVRAEGNLNAYNVLGFGDYFGLRYLPTGNDSTSIAPSCEGWGVAEAGTASTGYANLCDDAPTGSPPGTVNLADESFTTTATTAVSTTRLCESDGDPLVCKSSDSPLLRVTHDFHPISTNLYEATVTVANLSTHTVAPLYRRVVDWTLEPDTFEEGLTIVGKSSPYLKVMTNDGYSSANPLTDPLCTGGTTPGPCVDPYYELTSGVISASPTDQGSLFDLSLPSLVPGASLKFNLYHGAAGSKAAAASALTAVDADTYALALPTGDPTTGTPNTFMLAFRLDGVTVTNPPPPVVVPPPTTTTNPPPAVKTIQRKTPVSKPKALRLEILKRKFRRSALELTLRCNDDCDARVTGKLRLSGSKKALKLKKATRKLRAGVSRKVKMRLTKSAKRALRSVKRPKLRARLSLRAVGSEGRRLKRPAAFKL